MMSSNVVLLHSNNCCVVLEPAISEDLDLHVAIFGIFVFLKYGNEFELVKSDISFNSVSP